MKWFNKPKYKNVKHIEENTIPSGAWIKCPKCESLSLKKQLKDSYNVCNCGYHYKMPAKERIELLVDEGSFSELFENISTADPLKFSDAKGSYEDKITAAIKKQRTNEGVITGSAKIEDININLAVMDFSFLGGSMGSAVGEKIYQCMLLSIETGAPLIVVSSSGGARMHEGILSLMQMAKTCAGLEMMEKKGVPFISILTDPTTGGVTASFASLGDIIIAEPGALIGFAGPRVIEQTIRQKLPEGFQSSEFLKDHGFVDMVVKRTELKSTLVRIIRFFIN